jgi:hypothetical protein
VVAQAVALLHWFRCLRVRCKIRDDIHEAFLSLACAVIRCVGWPASHLLGAFNESSLRVILASSGGALMNSAPPASLP